MINNKLEKDWEGIHVQRFWDWYSKNNTKQSNYFTYQVGNGLKRLIHSLGMDKGNLLDYGCGAGYLLSKFGNQDGLTLSGLDYSSDSVNETNARMKGFDNWNEAIHAVNLPCEYNDNSFDSILLIETIEHLKSEIMDSVIKEIYRLLKPGGRLLVTTPFNENLAANFIYCPFCESEFHRMQHMHSFTIESMNKILKGYGFGVPYCSNIDLNYLEAGSVGKLIYNGKKVLKKIIASISKSIQIKENPHLIAVARKPS